VKRRIVELQKSPIPVPLLVGLVLAVVVGAFGVGYLVLAGSDEHTDTTGDGTQEITADDLPPTSWRPTLTVPDIGREQAGASSRPLEEDREAPSALRSLEVGCSPADDPVSITAPAADLRSVVAGAEPGTCFLLQPGTYSFSDVEPKDYMTFLGTARDEVVIQGSASTENAFHGDATGVTIGRMTLTGFQNLGKGGGKAQEQAPIRGTTGLWESDRGTLASEWLIEDIESSGNLAAGVFLGDNFTIRGSLLADNGVTGLGGSEIVGGLIEQNTIRGNGANAASGEYSNGAGIKFTEAIAGSDPVTVRSNEIYENRKIGVWCDIACDGFHVLNNYIHDQESRAVMYELSRNAVIQDNLLIDANTWTNYRQDFNAAAITLGESSDVTVVNNYIGGAKAGIIIRQTKRPVYPAEDFLDDYENVNFVSGDIEVVNNTLVDIDSMGISLGETGRSVGPDLGTIVFEGNSYNDPGAVDFWWDSDPVDFGSWQGSGRDTESPPVADTSPVWAGLDS
jgi:hypothetical protein